MDDATGSIRRTLQEIRKLSGEVVPHDGLSSSCPVVPIFINVEGPTQANGNPGKEVREQFLWKLGGETSA
jgi:hypothetical protein